MLRRPSGDVDAPGDTVRRAEPGVEAGRHEPGEAVRPEAADGEPASRPAGEPDPSGVTAVVGALRALERAPRPVVDETTAAPEEPTVRIGRIDVVVQAPPPPAAARSEGAPGDVLSRTYLRSL